ncbi:MAG: hypothetical protein DI551_03775 [Micavibrio aeruginosavorus]|uniref:Uncharacterized protein n=1 Tax=Micavibrio aeruginosavorus TaxID=349221 RepID=A0A2W5N3I3_9BACT|nr:MAG: hypothetical protein DI551_03775 [Micavibrio aeruginosavorus]
MPYVFIDEKVLRDKRNAFFRDLKRDIDRDRRRDIQMAKAFRAEIGAWTAAMQLCMDRMRDIQKEPILTSLNDLNSLYLNAKAKDLDFGEHPELMARLKELSGHRYAPIQPRHVYNVVEQHEISGEVLAHLAEASAIYVMGRNPYIPIDAMTAVEYFTENAKKCIIGYGDNLYYLGGTPQDGIDDPARQPN